MHGTRIRHLVMWTPVALTMCVATVAPAQPHMRMLGIAMPTTPPTLVHIPPWVAQDTGIFAKHGIEAKIFTFEGGPATLRALIGAEEKSNSRHREPHRSL